MSNERALFDEVLRHRELAGGERLTERESEVAYHRSVLGEGNTATAEALAISVHTVEAHIAKVCLKLGFRRPAEVERELFRDYVRLEARSQPV